MKKTFKKICYEDNSSYRLHHVTGYNVGKAYSHALHYDTGLTLAYFKHVSGNIKIEGKHYDLKDGDIIILNRDELHCVAIDNNKFCERITLFVNENILKNFDCEMNTFFDAFYNRKRGVGNHISAETAREYGLDTALEIILNHTMINDSVNSVLAICKIIELLAKLNKIISPTSPDIPLPTSENPIINNIIKYINNHFTEPINCNDIAEEFHLSKYYLTRFFKETVGISLWDYVIVRRLFLFNDLVRKNYSLQEACYKVGFNNYSNFYRLYKKHMNLSPSQFKEQINK